MMPAPARQLALKALQRIRRDRAFSGAVLSSLLRDARLSGADAALATRLVYGVLSTEGVLDEAIARHARGSLEPQVRDALRLGSFELLFARAPGYAVVDQAVSAVRSVRPRAAGLANAVLRRVAEEAGEFPWGDPHTDRDALARATGHPRWIVDEMIGSLGEERAREALGAGVEPAPTYVRLDPFMSPVEETLRGLAAAEPIGCEVDPDCFGLDIPSAAYGAGATTGYFSMDAAAQFAPRAVAPRAGERVLDVGAGRGNKTVCLQAIAVRDGGPAAVTAVDLHENKAARLRTRLTESGVPGVDVLAGDATDLEGLLGGARFDAVLLDVPCSGLGTLRRYPEKRWRLDPTDPARLAEVQHALLAGAAVVVGEGGRLVYATCSTTQTENADVVRGFLASPAGRRFALEPLGRSVPAEWARFVDSDGCFQSWPTSGGPDGHYVALLRAGPG